MKQRLSAITLLFGLLVQNHAHAGCSFSHEARTLHCSATSGAITKVWDISSKPYKSIGQVQRDFLFLHWKDEGLKPVSTRFTSTPVFPEISVQVLQNELGESEGDVSIFIRRFGDQNPICTKTQAINRIYNAGTSSAGLPEHEGYYTHGAYEPALIKHIELSCDDQGIAIEVICSQAYVVKRFCI